MKCIILEDEKELRNRDSCPVEGDMDNLVSQLCHHQVLLLGVCGGGRRQLEVTSSLILLSLKRAGKPTGSYAGQSFDSTSFFVFLFLEGR